MTTNRYAHLLGAPRTALDRMAGQTVPADSWDASHARIVGDTGAAAAKPSGADSASASKTTGRSTASGADSWDASARRTGAGK